VAPDREGLRATFNPAAGRAAGPGPSPPLELCTARRPPGLIWTKSMAETLERLDRACTGKPGAGAHDTGAHGTRQESTGQPGGAGGSPAPRQPCPVEAPLRS
jgi:hypothetical protein